MNVVVLSCLLQIAIMINHSCAFSSLFHGITIQMKPPFNLNVKKNAEGSQDYYYYDDYYNENDPFREEVNHLFHYSNILEDSEVENESIITQKTRRKETKGNSTFTFDLSGLDEFDQMFDAMEDSEALSSTSLETNKTVNTEMTDEPRLLVPDLNTLLSSVQLAPASEIAYFYLQNTIGLSAETMWKITNTAGSVLGFTVSNLETKISLLKRLMNLTDQDVREILTKQPTILHMSSTRNISPTILYLVRALDLSKSELRHMVVSYPAILCYSLQNLQGKLSFFQKDLRLNVDQTRKLVVQEPRLLCAAVKTGLIPRLKFLHKEMKISISDVGIIVMGNPKILLYSLKDNICPKIIWFFVMRLQMESHHISKLLKSYPLIMDYNLEEHMLPIARYFLNELEFSPMELRRILLKFPRLMTYSMFKIKHVVGYFRFQLYLDPVDVKRVLFQAPQTISLNTEESIVKKVGFLRETFGLENDDELRKVITGQPTLLLCSIEGNIQPKAEYLLQQFGWDRLELKQAILTLPTLLAYSLEKRIKPRMESILDLDLEPAKITIGIVMTEVNFNKWLQKQSERTKPKHMSPFLNDDGYTGDSVPSMEIDNYSLDKQVLDGRIRHWKR